MTIKALKDNVYMVDDWWNSFTYFFRRKYRQVRNVFRWLPIIWNQFDFDYRYSLEVFKFQLLKQADNMETNGMLLGSENRAKRIRTIIALMDKVYDDEYAMEYYDKSIKLYGKYEYKFVPINETTYNPITKKVEELSEMVQVWEMNWTKEELVDIDTHIGQMMIDSAAKQKRAHKLLWELVEHNIQGFWD